MPIFRSSMSMQMTSFPLSARHVPVTRPTYPVPMTDILMVLSFSFYPEGPVNHRVTGMRRDTSTARISPGNTPSVTVLLCKAPGPLRVPVRFPLWLDSSMVSRGIVPLDPCLVLAAPHPVDPCPVLQVPGDGGAETAGKIVPAAPAELPLDLVAIDGVPAIVTRPVRHEGDEVPVCPGPGRPQILQYVADGTDDIDVPQFAFAANIVGLAGPPGGQDPPDRLAVVIHVEPVAHVRPVAVD